MKEEQLEMAQSILRIAMLRLRWARNELEAAYGYLADLSKIIDPEDEPG